MRNIHTALLLAGLFASVACIAQVGGLAGRKATNDPVDDRSTLPPERAYVPTANAYAVAVTEGQGIQDVRRAATEVLGEEVMAEPMFPDVDPADDPEGLSRLYRVVATGAKDIGSQWDSAYAIRDAGKFEQVEPDTETAIEEGRKRQAATASCVVNAGVTTPEDIQWSLEQMRVREARILTPGPGGMVAGEGIRICHPDSGWTEHVDLDMSRIDTANSLNLIEGGTDARDPLNYSGHPGHGTATGSLLISSGGFDSSGKPTGPGSVNGLAPKATLVPIRAFKSVVHVFDSDIAKAVRHASRAKCDVISMSLGGKGFFGLEKAIKDAVRRDIIVVSAAGNCAGFVVAPASYENVIAVAATNFDRKPWPGSSQGKAVDISAPGEDVYVARPVAGVSPGALVKDGNGTSFATAEVAGAAANWLAFHGKEVIKNAQGSLTRQRLFMLALSRSADTDPGWNKRRMGAGILNLENLLKQPLPSGAGLLAAPPRFDYVTEIEQRFDLDRNEIEHGLKRILRHPEDFEGTLEEYGPEIIDIATRDPDAFVKAIKTPPLGAFAVPSTLVHDKGSRRLRGAISR